MPLVELNKNFNSAEAKQSVIQCIYVAMPRIYMSCGSCFTNMIFTNVHGKSNFIQIYLQS